MGKRWVASVEETETGGIRHWLGDFSLILSNRARQDITSEPDTKRKAMFGAQTSLAQGSSFAS